jgi:MFS family permease
MKTPPTPPLRLSWFMWGLGALLYLLGFFHRVAPAVMTEPLMRDFHINAAALGNLSAFYFYSYVAMQIPTGIIADTWGPRRLLTLGALVAGAGAVIFAMAPSFFLAGLGRLLIGGSVAVAWVGLLKLAANWFPTALFAMVTGMALFFGIIGAVAAGTPLHLLTVQFGWRNVILATALMTLAVAAAIWRFVRDTPSERGYADYVAAADRTAGGSWADILGGLREIFQYPNTLLLCFIPGAVVGAVLTFAGLWGVPFLTTHYHLPTGQAAALTSALLVAWAVGGAGHRLALGQHGAQKNTLHLRLHGHACWMGGHRLSAGTAHLGPDGHSAGNRIRFRLHDRLVRLCQRIGAPSPGRDGVGRHQHGGHDGAHAAAAGGGLGA